MTEGKNNSLKEIEAPVKDMVSQLEKIVNWLSKTPEHSKWLLTINTGSLGFIMAMLFQIKAKGDIPNKIIALLASGSFILSIIAGVCFYIGLALNSLALGFKKFFQASRKLFTKAKMEKNSESKIKEFNEIAETIIKDIDQKSTKRVIIVFSLVFFQWMFFILGILFTTIYMFIYLFL